MLKHYVEYLYSDGGSFIRNHIEEIPSRDINNVNFSTPRCIGFRLFDVTVDEGTLTGKTKNISGWHYKGKKMSIEQLRNVNSICAESCLRTMEFNGEKECVDTGVGHFFGLKENDIVIES